MISEIKYEFQSYKKMVPLTACPGQVVSYIKDNGNFEISKWLGCIHVKENLFLEEERAKIYALEFIYNNEKFDVPDFKAIRAFKGGVLGKKEGLYIMLEDNNFPLLIDR